MNIGSLAKWIPAVTVAVALFAAPVAQAENSVSGSSLLQAMSGVVGSSGSSVSQSASESSAGLSSREPASLAGPEGQGTWAGQLVARGFTHEQAAAIAFGPTSAEDAARCGASKEDFQFHFRPDEPRPAMVMTSCNPYEVSFGDWLGAMVQFMLHNISTLFGANRGE